MKTKLTLTDCHKYPNTAIREYKKGKIVCEYKNLLELLAFKCVTVWVKPKYQLKEANKYLANCKLVLKKLTYAQNYFLGVDKADIKYIDKLRLRNYDIDGLQESGRAVYE